MKKQTRVVTIKLRVAPPAPREEVKKRPRVIPGKGKILCLVALASSLSACSSTAFTGDQFTLRGTPEGIDSFADLMIGTQTESKNDDPSIKSPYWQNRDQKILLKLKRREK